MALLVIIQFASAWSPYVPPLSSVFILLRLPTWPTFQPVPPSPTLLGVWLHLLGGGLFVLAAELTRRHHRRTGAQGEGFLAVGLGFGAFGEFHPAVLPRNDGGLVWCGGQLN